ncbi:MAG: fumarate hydratase [Treponemataceae bacterium]
MRTISPQLIIDQVKRLCIESCSVLDNKILNALKLAYKNEAKSDISYDALCNRAHKNFKVGSDNILSAEILNQIIENDIIAKNQNIPMCQDTGIMVVFVEMGNEVFIDGDINEIINRGVAAGYKEGYLRKSVVKSPLNRINTNDNTPAVIHISIVKGDKLKLSLCPKGAGSENMSKVKMLNPSDGVQGVKEFVLDTVEQAGGKSCPPLFVGVGIGGDIEKCAQIAKQSLLRPIDDKSKDKDARRLEEELFELINNLNIGPMGLGGKTTCLAVKVNLFPCHIASLPVCVNLQCHAVRHKEVIL